ncbi:dynein axonemal intermediate chain 3 [Dendroctonus ponderosae]|nr:dynein axonemal intermediate chain 3 [Dendroctonus ponderosae]
MHEDEEDALSKSMSARRRRRRKKKKRDLFDIDGVRRIVMSELTQKIVQCVVGDQVTSESPWTYVKKELVQDNLELHEESSEFLPLRAEILAYPRPEILIGYIADESQEKEEEFYMCVTEGATDAVEKIIEKLRQEQEDRLYYQLYKDVHPWQSLGAEVEVDEALVRQQRPLLEVEVETEYPIFPGKVQFRMLRAECKRDGYIELRCAGEESFSSVVLRRIDSGVQVAPLLRTAEAQTICTYPRNATSQYQYDPGPTDALLAECEPDIARYANHHLASVCDVLQVNGAINFYANDFDSLARSSALANNSLWAEQTGRELVEYLSFMDVTLCKGKMISDICWHPMWSGTIAIAYCAVSPNIFNVGAAKDDEVYRAVHTVNLVLIWSFLDGLKPRLVLESPREVYKVSFCGFDENVLIGGCRNGQVVIWDIRNKLQRVEEKEVLTTAQQKYRSYLHSLMGWMKDTHDVSIVRPAAVSELRHSHKAAVTGVSWVDPHFQFTRTGKLGRADAPPTYSMQFLTTGLDGAVLIWDLQDSPTIQSGGYKPKRLRRLQKRPSALQVDESPFRALHLNLKPRYRISAKGRGVAITRSSTSFCRLRYAEANPDASRRFDMRERIIYRPLLDAQRHLRPEIKIGTTEGEYAQLAWEGQDFDSGEVVNCEVGVYLDRAQYHDGPIISICTCKESGFTLTVGGKVFALWRGDFPGRPLLWRRSRHFYTKGELNPFQPFTIVLHSVTGALTRWILPLNSRSPIFHQVMSNGFLTAAAVQPHAQQKTVYGIGDEQGAFRLFYLKQPTAAYAEGVARAMQTFVQREVQRKRLFWEWQAAFNGRHEGRLVQRRQEEAAARAQEEAAKEAQRTELAKVEERPIRRGPLPGRYMEWTMEQRQAKEEARIKAMIITKKQLDTKELEKRRKPLQKLDEENERKKRKQKERLKQGETIFQHTVASLFPDVVKGRPPQPPDPYAGGDSHAAQLDCFQRYQQLQEAMERFIPAHPLQYEFSFKNLLVASRAKDQSCFRAHAHTRRRRLERQQRTPEEPEGRPGEEEPADLEERELIEEMEDIV